MILVNFSKNSLFRIRKIQDLNFLSIPKFLFTSLFLMIKKNPRFKFLLFSLIFYILYIFYILTPLFIKNKKIQDLNFIIFLVYINFIGFLKFLNFLFLNILIIFCFLNIHLILWFFRLIILILFRKTECYTLSSLLL